MELHSFTPVAIIYLNNSMYVFSTPPPNSHSQPQLDTNSEF